MYTSRTRPGDVNPRAPQLPLDTTGQALGSLKDSSYVRRWVDTSAKVPLSFMDMTAPLSSTDQALYSMENHGLSLEYPLVHCNGNLYGTDLQASVAPNNLYLQTDSLSSDDGSHSGEFPQERVGAADMKYTTSSHSMAFSSDYPYNSGIACSAGSLPQATFSVSTAWSSPSSASMEPAWVSSYSAPVFVSTMNGSPPLFAGSEDALSNSSGYEEILPAPLVDYCGRSPIDFCQPEMTYSENTRLMNESSGLVSAPDVVTIRPPQDHSRPPITEGTFWPPVETAPMVVIPGLDASYHDARRVINGPSNATAREHPLYHMEPSPIDGLYHCPFGATEGCRHKADKLKCNYEYDPNSPAAGAHAN